MKGNDIVKKKLSIMISAVLVGAFMTACAQTPAPTAPTQETPSAQTPNAETSSGVPEAIANGTPVELRVAWWGNDARAEAMEAAIDIFTDRYPSVTVNIEHGVWGGGAWTENMITQLAGGVEADIMQVNYAWIHSFGRGQNVFLDLNTVSDYIDLSEWTADELNFMTTGGELAAVPHGMNGRVMIYNHQMLEEFGLDSFPTTIEELVAYGELVAANNNAVDDGSNRYAFLPIGPETLDIVILTMLYNHTGRTMQENGQMLHTVEEVQYVFDQLGWLQDTNTIPTFHQMDPIQNESNPTWTAGNGGAAFEWVSNIFVVGSTFGGGDRLDDLGIAPLPSFGGTQATMQRPSLGHAISRNTNHPEVAAYLLNFLYTDEDALMAIGSTLGIPFPRTASEVAEREGIIAGHQALGLEILETGTMGVMDPLFEDAALRQPRFAIIEAFRSESIDSATAAQRFINEQQAALNMLN